MGFGGASAGLGITKGVKILQGESADLVINGVVNAYLGSKLNAAGIVLCAKDLREDEATLANTIGSATNVHVSLSGVAGDAIWAITPPTESNPISIPIDTNAYQLETTLQYGDG